VHFKPEHLIYLNGTNALIKFDTGEASLYGVFAVEKSTVLEAPFLPLNGDAEWRSFQLRHEYENINKGTHE